MEDYRLQELIAWLGEREDRMNELADAHSARGMELLAEYLRGKAEAFNEATLKVSEVMRGW